jgi:hypothetical protein
MSGHVGPPFAQKTSLIDVSASSTIGAAVDTEQFNQYAIVMPAAWTGSADITFQGANKADDTFVAILDETGTAVPLVAPATSEALSLSETQMRYLRPWRFIKPIAGAQGADRTLTFQLSME